MSQEYNYRNFASEHYDFGCFPGPEVGKQAQDFTALTLDGRTARLSDFFGRPIVLESGSLTCGVYVGKVRAMEEVAVRHPEALFLVLYVREAHPGERGPAHQSLEEKRRNAQRLVSEEGENRLILIDALNGEAHRAYGPFPDMAYVLDCRGVVVARLLWNDPKAVERVLDALKAGLPPPTTESRAFVPAFNAHLRTMKRAGWQAVLDFVKAMPKLLWIDYVKGR